MMKSVLRLLGVLGLIIVTSTACDDDSSGSGSDAGGGANGTGTGSGGSGGGNVTGDASPDGSGGSVANTGGADAMAAGGSGGTVVGGAGGTVVGGTGGTAAASCGNSNAPCALTTAAAFSGKGVGEGDGFFTFTAPEAATYTLTFMGPPFGNVNFDRTLDGQWAFLCDTTGGVNAPCCSLGPNATSCQVILQSADRGPLTAGQKVRIHVYAPGAASYSVSIAKKQ